MKRPRLLLLPLLATTWTMTALGDDGPRSRPIAEVLREPLPSEDLTLSKRDGRIVIAGPTFEYVVDEATGATVSLRAWRDGKDVVRLVAPARVVVGPFATDARGNVGATVATPHGRGKVVLQTQATMRDGDGRELPYELTTTVFNDGVAVSEYALRPKADLAVAEIRHELKAVGAFRQCLHKTRDTNGFDAPMTALPKPGEAIAFSNLTSCLQVSSPRAGLAIFTDRGATLAAEGLETAVAKVVDRQGDEATVEMVQHVVREPSADRGLRLKAGESFSFRVGVSVVPNRKPHRRSPDLRMFAWIGDDKNPYPSDAEIRDVARLGFTLFQMHRLGTPGIPRPPAEELDRVVKTVHDAGMLFIWTANADLMYASAPGVEELRAKGQWPLWRGFNYGGRYKDSMDSYCDLAATCLASPNGLADYRVATIADMLDRYAVDGMYIDDDLAYANCTLQSEHGHPEKVYDCLIELHEMNWRRRQALHARRPHAVLIDHCAKATVQPVICPFDAHIYGEGYSFPSLDDYWAKYGAFQGMDAHGCLWPGGKDADRSATEVSYNIDLLAGGGQYMYIDWRLYPEKFSYAAGVTGNEVPLVRAYNQAQYGFGMYESSPFFFAESADLFAVDAPGVYATVYRNDVWGDHLVVLANMNAEAGDASLSFRSPDRLGLKPDGRYAVLDVRTGKCRRVDGGELLKEGIAGGSVPGRGMKLFYLRPLADDAPRHLWGGKRIAERWDAEKGALALELQGPPDSTMTVILAAGARPIGKILVNGEPAGFRLDPAQGVVHGEVRFGAGPVRVEVSTSPGGRGGPPEGPTPPLDLPER